MANKRPKRRGLIANSKRQANDPLRGYRYQILCSVEAWLELADDEILHLEGVEDFDIVSNNTATLVQVKDTRRNVTLKSKEVLDAINHYCEFRTKHPDLTVKFRFITRSKIGKERSNLFGNGQRGIYLWSQCSGDEETVTRISDFLQDQEKISDTVKKFLKQTDPQEIYEHLIKPITWETGSNSASSIEQSINEKLINHGHRYKVQASYAKNVREALLNEAFRVATHPDPENRELTKARFCEFFEEKTTVRVPIQQYIQEQQSPASMFILNYIKSELDHIKATLMGNTSDIATQLQPQQQRLDPTLILNYIKSGLDDIKAALMRNTPDITIQSQPQSPIQKAIPRLYDDVIHRTDLLTSIQTKLQSEDIVVIHGGAGKGKTTLAKLIANDVKGSWLWLKSTDREPSEVGQLLQQLATEISKQSSQVNVVLDDLNLQPQQLRTYKEELSVLVYKVIEHGAKLLITSQYKPHSNLLRNLGLSSSVVINVPNFTIPEIEQFAQQLGCPEEDAKTWAELFQFPTRRHPGLIHALFTHLREKDWEQQDVIKSIWHPPQEVVEEHEAARQLLMDLPEDRREFLYRLSLLTEFRKDYAGNIGEIPKPIPYPGDVFSQLVGPWIDQISENYYTISPLLKDAAKGVWSETKISNLHAEVANAILKANNLTPIEARSVFLHSITGRNREGLVAVIWSLITSSQDNWEIVSKEFSFLIPMEIELPEKLFIGDAFVKYLIRFLQYRIAAKVKPEFAPKILEVWDKETKAQQQSQEYQLLRRMLAMEALRYNQVLLPAKQMVDYLQEFIEITNSDEDVQDVHDNLIEQLGEHKTDKSSIFSILFSFVYTRPPIYAPFLSDLIDALDELQPENRTLLLADFENDNIESRLLIDSVWLAEANRKEQDWTRCLQVFDKVIEKTIAWGYPYIAAASARGKAIIHDEYLKDPDTAHELLQDIISKVGALPIVEEAQAVVYFNQKRYKDALNIYERILPKWNPPSEQLNLGPLEEYRRAAICAASLNDWKKAAIFLEDGAKRTQKIENTERYISLYADAGFARFKAGNLLNSIELLNLALQKFEMIPQDNTDVKYFTLKERLVYTMRWIVAPNPENYASELEALPAGFCSNPDTDEKVLDLPDSLIAEAWVNLAQIEYKFGRNTTAFERALQITDRKAYPVLDTSLSLLETQYDFRNKTFDNLPQRICQLARAFVSIQKHDQSGKGIGEKGIYSISIPELSNFASIETISSILVPALVTQLVTGQNMQDILSTWRANSSELPIKDDIFTTLDLIESMLFGSENNALTVLKTQENKSEERIAAALKVVQNKETSPEDLLYAHTFITTSLIGKTWAGFAVNDLAKLLSTQWKEKTREIPIKAVSEVEKACNSRETGKKKIGQILLAASQSVSGKVPPEILQQFRSWTDNP